MRQTKNETKSHKTVGESAHTAQTPLTPPKPRAGQFTQCMHTHKLTANDVVVPKFNRASVLLKYSQSVELSSTRYVAVVLQGARHRHGTPTHTNTMHTTISCHDFVTQPHTPTQNGNVRSVEACGTRGSPRTAGGWGRVSQRGTGTGTPRRRAWTRTRRTPGQCLGCPPNGTRRS